jgi:hypothetical protein
MANADVDPDLDTDAGDPGEWEPVETTRRRSPGLVLSVRVSPELAQALQQLAEVQRTSVSETARRLLGDAIAKLSPATSLNVRVVGLSATMVHGVPSEGGESKQRTAAELGVAS